MKKYFVSEPNRKDIDINVPGLNLKINEANPRVEVTEDQKKIIEEKYPYLKIDEE